MSWQERALCRSRAWGWFAGRVVLPWALQGTTPYGDVLEVGSGSGAIADEILSRFPSVRFTATDYDPDMVALAAARLAPHGDRVAARQADAAALPFRDESFDAVLAFLMLHHVGSWEQALAEAARVLRPRGLLIGYDLLANAATRSLHRLGPGHGERLVDRAALESALRACPFKAITIGGVANVLVTFRASK